MISSITLLVVALVGLLLTIAGPIVAEIYDKKENKLKSVSELLNNLNHFGAFLCFVVFVVWMSGGLT